MHRQTITSARLDIVGAWPHDAVSWLESQLPSARPAGFDRWAPSRRAEFALGRKASHEALIRAGAPATELVHSLQATPDRRPLWPLGWTGSISHSVDPASGARVLEAIVAPTSKAIGLGIDWESLSRMQTAPALWNRVSDPEERIVLCSHLASEEVQAAVIFSAKESLFKALYPQVLRYQGFEAARLIEASNNQGKIHLQFALTRAWGSRWPAGHLLSAMAEVLENRWVRSEVVILANQ